MTTYTLFFNFPRFLRSFFLKANPIEKSFVDFTVRSCFEGKGDLYIHNKKLQFSIFVREWSQYVKKLTNTVWKIVMKLLRK